MTKSTSSPADNAPSKWIMSGLYEFAATDDPEKIGAAFFKLLIAAVGILILGLSTAGALLITEYAATIFAAVYTTLSKAGISLPLVAGLSELISAILALPVAVFKLPVAIIEAAVRIPTEALAEANMVETTYFVMAWGLICFCLWGFSFIRVAANADFNKTHGDAVKQREEAIEREVERRIKEIRAGGEAAT